MNLYVIFVQGVMLIFCVSFQFLVYVLRKQAPDVITLEKVTCHQRMLEQQEMEESPRGFQMTIHCSTNEQVKFC